MCAAAGETRNISHTAVRMRSEGGARVMLFNA